MKSNVSISFLSVLAISVILILIRFAYTEKDQVLPVKVTTWDALGYYLYLPANVIYHDQKKLDWYPAIEQRYHLSGGDFYQAGRLANGNFVFKYLGGLAVLQLPFFLIAHFFALHSNYPADGFSAPYQYAIAWGCLFYCVLAIFLLRQILLRYFQDAVVAISLILLLLASNFIQYVSIEGGQSHGYIFPLYVFILWLSIRWFETPRLRYSIAIGFVIGLALICRPTEGVMLFIPLLWGITKQRPFSERWQWY